jgi:hypothetical protein
LAQEVYVRMLRVSDAEAIRNPTLYLRSGPPPRRRSGVLRRHIPCCLPPAELEVVCDADPQRTRLQKDVIDLRRHAFTIKYSECIEIGTAVGQIAREDA